MTSGDIRVLIVDDSPAARRWLRHCLLAVGGIGKVLEAEDGEQGLQIIASGEVDVVLLDLEMPRMDGYAVLRIVSANYSLPVLVVSSHAGRGSVFQALELGAIDFIPKPDSYESRDSFRSCRHVRNKLTLVRALRWIPRGRPMMDSRPDAEPPSSRGGRTRSEPPPPSSRSGRVRSEPPPASSRGRRRMNSDPSLLVPTAVAGRARRKGAVPRRLVAIVASTGGPMAVRELLRKWEPDEQCAVVVAIHMPEKFTEAFAARLDRTTRWSVGEARHGEVLTGGKVLLAPGGKNLQVVEEEGSGRWRAAVRGPGSDDTYVPSGDVLLQSVAAVAGTRAGALILSGMGQDGARGAAAVAGRGGAVWVQAPSEAVVDGMPRATVENVPEAKAAPLHVLAMSLTEWARRGVAGDRGTG